MYPLSANFKQIFCKFFFKILFDNSLTQDLSYPLLSIIALAANQRGAGLFRQPVACGAGAGYEVQRSFYRSKHQAGGDVQDPGTRFF
jgi:hypothetical protein